MRAILIGGHLSPLLAVIDALPKGVEALVVGRKYALEGDRALSLEHRIIKEKKVAFFPITTARLQRKFTSQTFLSLFKFPFGFIQSLIILINFRPNVVLSFGGYVALPVTLASFFLGIPVVIHEQTLGAGLANKIASIFARKVCISWEESRRFFPKSKTILTGNPIRKFRIFPPEADQPLAGEFRISNEKLPLIYVTGGSSGAHAINVLVEGVLSKLLQKYRIIHQTGDAREFNDFERLSKYRDELEPRLKNRYIPLKFVNPKDVAEVLQKADLVLGRSGINTVSELFYFEKPALLIPLPFSQNNEQTKNALFLKAAGLAEVFTQEKLDPQTLYPKITAMLDNINSYKVSREYKGFIKKDATEDIISVLLKEGGYVQEKAKAEK